LSHLGGGEGATSLTLERFLQVHGHDNPIGAARDRWPATGYAGGTQWEWILAAAQTLVHHLPE